MQTAQTLRQRRGYESHSRSSFAWVFTATIFLSATLLFSVQPMFTKLILPLLGGAPNVWNTAMVFFQSLLLCGYLYAHFSSRYLSLKSQITIHLLITVLGLAFIPLAVGEVSVPNDELPILWLFGLFFVTVGLPFFALSANAPLLQRWFSLSDHKDAEDPYFLYSASNAGSLLILCAYPFIIEPFISLGGQTELWMGGYLALIVALGLTGWMVMTRKGAVQKVTRAEHRVALAPKAAPPTKTVLFWICLAFIPSSLMLGVTSYMSNNIASVPFLWIMPLALYLLTFVLAFARRPIINSSQLGVFIPWIILGNIGALFWPGLPAIVVIAACLASFFVITFYCHARLVEARPTAAYLTQFYIIMSLGGVLGGVFNALIAPALFVGTYEYMIVLIVAAFIRPRDIRLFVCNPSALRSFVITLSLAILTGAAFTLVADMPTAAWMSAALVTYMALAHLQIWRPLGVAMLLGALATPFLMPDRGYIIYQDRSFYSAIKVERIETSQGLMHSFVHGNTIHNYQLREPGLREEPTAYYARGGSFDAMLQDVRHDGQALAVSLIGMGAGAMSCYEQPGDQWTYFEIDPAVVKMALDPALFSYLQDCAPSADIRIGDARQRLADIAPGSQDLLIIDAFSANAIPAHLLTREALALYKSRLKPGGVIFFHTSNRLLDVSSVVARLADDAGWSARFINKVHTEAVVEYTHSAQGLLVGPSNRIEMIAEGSDDWSIWMPSAYVPVWTDDYSSVLATLWAKFLRDGHEQPID